MFKTIRLFILSFWIMLPVPLFAGDTNPCAESQFCSADYLRDKVKVYVDDDAVVLAGNKLYLLVDWYKLSKEKDLLKSAYDILTASDAPTSVSAALQKIYLAGILADETEVGKRQEELRDLLREGVPAVKQWPWLFLAALEKPDGLPTPEDCRLIAQADAKDCFEGYFNGYYQLVSPYRIENGKILDVAAVDELLVKSFSSNAQDGIEELEKSFNKSTFDALVKRGDMTQTYAFLKDIHFDVYLFESRAAAEFMFGPIKEDPRLIPPEIVDVKEVGDIVRQAPSTFGYRFFYDYAKNTMPLDDITDWFAAIDNIDLVDADILIALVYRNIYAQNEERAQVLRDKWRAQMGTHDPIDKLLANGKDDKFVMLTVDSYETYVNESADNRPCQFYLDRQNRMDTWIGSRSNRSSNAVESDAFDELIKEKGVEIAQDCKKMGIDKPILYRFILEGSVGPDMTDDAIDALFAEAQAIETRVDKVYYLGLTANKLMKSGHVSAATKFLKEIDYDALDPESEDHLHFEDFKTGSVTYGKDPIHEGKQYAHPKSAVDAARNCIALSECFPDGRPDSMVMLGSKSIEAYKDLIDPIYYDLDVGAMEASLNKEWDRLNASEVAKLVRIYAWVSNWYRPYKKLDHVTEVLQKVFALSAEKADYIGTDAYSMTVLLKNIGEHQNEENLPPYQPFWQVVGNGYRTWSQSTEFTQSTDPDFADVLDRMYRGIITYGDSVAINAAGLLQTEEGAYDVVDYFKYNPWLLTPQQVLDLNGITFENPNQDAGAQARVDNATPEAGENIPAEAATAIDAYRDVLSQAYGLQEKINLIDALKIYSEHGLLDQAGIIFEHMTDEDIRILMQYSLDDADAPILKAALHKDEYLQRLFSLDENQRFLAYMLDQAVEK